MAHYMSASARQVAATACRLTGNRQNLAVVAGLTLALSACSSPRYATVDAPLEPALGAAVIDYDSTYTSVVPRAFIDIDDLDENAPDGYTVVKGDTLWDISDRFLKKPWLWSTLWNYNPAIANPHLIYPGDRLQLEYVNNRPSLVLSRNGKPVPFTEPRLGAANAVGPNGEPLLGAATPNAERLSPRIRSESLEEAIPVIKSDAIASFLLHPRVINPGAASKAPYIVANDEGRMTSIAGEEIYARGNIDPSISDYRIYRRQDRFYDPVTGEFLGQELAHVADASLREVGDPSTLVIVSNKTEANKNDILLPTAGSGLVPDFTPRLPDIRGDGRVVSLNNALTQTGRDQIIVLNLGERSGVQPGDILAIETRGGNVTDPRLGRYNNQVTLPNSRNGVVMVFQTFEKVSYALIMESSRPIRVNDLVTGI